MTSLKRIYWDACSWIALIQKERILDDKGALIEDRYTMCRSVISAAEKSAIAAKSLKLVGHGAPPYVGRPSYTWGAGLPTTIS